MTKIKQPQYFIATVPETPLSDEVNALREYVGERYESSAALRSPPHITLHMPFRWREDREAQLVSTLSEFIKAGSFDEFTIALRDFGAFAPHVIFVGVVPNEALNNLQHALVLFCRQKLNLFNADYKDRPYHPHVTIAFRDLKKAQFLEAWREFETRKFKADFVARGISLLKHDGHRWEVIHTIGFKG